MATGMVSFHNDKVVKRGQHHSHPNDYSGPRADVMTVHIKTRDNAIVNRLNKTKVEKEVDHESERQERLRLEGRKKKLEAIDRVRTALH
jgi:hypothetical protein